MCKKTTRQLQALLKESGVTGIEVDVRQLRDGGADAHQQFAEFCGTAGQGSP